MNHHIIATLIPQTANLSAMARAIGVSPAILGKYRADSTRLRNASAQTVARLARMHKLNTEEKARLIDELAE